MHLTRRQWIKGASSLAAASMMPWPLRANQPAAPLIHLQARETTAAWLDAPTPIWAYNQPLLRLQQGVSQRIRVTNQLPEPTTVHWHGLRVANAMDGVSGLTQAPIEPGETFDYDIQPQDAGTFWFHSHHNTIEQLARGLYGALIVSAANEPSFEHDWSLLIDDWRLNNQGRIDPAFTDLHTQAHGGRLGNVLTINQRLGPWRQEATEGDRVRIRLVNCATNRILQLRADFPGALILAKDGQPLAEPEPLPDVFIMGPGERFDLGWRVSESGRLLEISGQQPFTIAEVQARRQNTPTTSAETGIVALPLNPMPRVSIDISQRVPLRLEGGAMGQLSSARFNGETLSFRQLVNRGQAWAFSGQAGLPEEPLFRARAGDTVAIDLENRTAFAHTLHWHGHHVWADDRWQDSLTLTRNEKKTVHMVAEGTGKWLIHCHMIDHQATGMMTWFEVV